MTTYQIPPNFGWANQAEAQALVALRNQFAHAALYGLLARSYAALIPDSIEPLVKDAWDIADAMLAEGQARAQKATESAGPKVNFTDAFKEQPAFDSASWWVIKCFHPNVDVEQYWSTDKSTRYPKMEQEERFATVYQSADIAAALADVQAKMPQNWIARAFPASLSRISEPDVS